jgi:hypothetical protein
MGAGVYHQIIGDFLIRDWRIVVDWAIPEW